MSEPTMEQWGRYMRELRDTGHLTDFGRGFLAGVEAHERSAGAAPLDVTWNALKATLREAIAPGEAAPTEYEHSFVIRAPIDVEVLARAIWLDYYSDSDDKDIQDWQRDLNNSVEIYDNPREWAERIAAAYARLASEGD